MTKNAKAVGTVAAATVVTKKETLPGVLKVKQGVALRGARKAWYEELVKHDGKPVADFLVAMGSKPPSTPKSGVAEKPQGWLSWFTRSGIAQVVAP